jgi:chromosome segregation ATPase
MRTLQLLSAITLIGSLTACSSSDKKDPILEEAAQYHNQATEVQEVIEPRIEQIDSLKTVLAAQKTPDSAARIATLDSLKTAFEEWEKNLVEVPGMPHDHKHDHGKGEHKHNHADATLKDLPAEQMLDLQRETLNNIKQIQTRLEATMP